MYTIHLNVQTCVQILCRILTFKGLNRQFKIAATSQYIIRIKDSTKNQLFQLSVDRVSNFTQTSVSLIDGSNEFLMDNSQLRKMNSMDCSYNWKICRKHHQSICFSMFYHFSQVQNSTLHSSFAMRSVLKLRRSYKPTLVYPVLLSLMASYERLLNSV